MTLVKPRDLLLTWTRKLETHLGNERVKHADLARQLSFLQPSTKSLEPCPFEFKVRWIDEGNKEHNQVCDDWETSSAFFVRRNALGEAAALLSLRDTYEREYMTRGVRLALGTHSRRATQWLLVGIIRVDDDPQAELFLS